MGDTSRHDEPSSSQPGILTRPHLLRPHLAPICTDQRPVQRAKWSRRFSVQTPTSASSIVALPSTSRRLSLHTPDSGPLTGAVPSPSLIAAREYALEQIPAYPYDIDGLQRRKGLSAVKDFPRRHSVLSPTAKLIPRMDNVTISYPLARLPEAPDIKLEDGEEGATTLLATPGRKYSEMAKVGVIAARRVSTTSLPLEAGVLIPVPFQYTHDRLRDWGYAYLGNMATADAFVNAVSLRRPSLVFMNELDDEGRRPRSNEGKGRAPNRVTIRARVIPRASERKPFIIQRQFDIEELRGNIPPVRQPRTSPNAMHSSSFGHLAPSRRSSFQDIAVAPRKAGKVAGGIRERRLLGLRNGRCPMHVEYALHYLPVLAALMLSGHVRKGDSIDLPIPHPEAWRDVVRYIYTGKGEVTPTMREDILYLAGRAE